MSDLTKIVDELSYLTVLECAELSKKLEDAWGVSASAPVAMGVAPVADAAEEVEEQTEFNVILTGFGEKKINVIKEVRAQTNLGLKEAKDLVENVPGTVKEGISKEDAEALKTALEAVGATVELK